MVVLFQARDNVLLIPIIAVLLLVLKSMIEYGSYNIVIIFLVLILSVSMMEVISLEFIPTLAILTTIGL